MELPSFAKSVIPPPPPPSANHRNQNSHNPLVTPQRELPLNSQSVRRNEPYVSRSGQGISVVYGNQSVKPKPFQQNVTFVDPSQALLQTAAFSKVHREVTPHPTNDRVFRFDEQFTNESSVDGNQLASSMPTYGLNVSANQTFTSETNQDVPCQRAFVEKELVVPGPQPVGDIEDTEPVGLDVPITHATGPTENEAVEFLKFGLPLRSLDLEQQTSLVWCRFVSATRLDTKRSVASIAGGQSFVLFEAGLGSPGCQYIGTFLDNQVLQSVTRSELEADVVLHTVNGIWALYESNRVPGNLPSYFGCDATSEITITSPLSHWPLWGAVKSPQLNSDAEWLIRHMLRIVTQDRTFSQLSMQAACLQAASKAASLVDQNLYPENGCPSALCLAMGSGTETPLINLVPRLLYRPLCGVEFKGELVDAIVSFFSKLPAGHEYIVPAFLLNVKLDAQGSNLQYYVAREPNINKGRTTRGVHITSALGWIICRHMYLSMQSVKCCCNQFPPGLKFLETQVCCNSSTGNWPILSRSLGHSLPERVGDYPCGMEQKESELSVWVAKTLQGSTDPVMMGKFYKPLLGLPNRADLPDMSLVESMCAELKTKYAIKYLASEYTKERYFASQMLGLNKHLDTSLDQESCRIVGQLPCNRSDFYSVKAGVMRDDSEFEDFTDLDVRKLAPSRLMSYSLVQNHHIWCVSDKRASDGSFKAALCWPSCGYSLTTNHSLKAVSLTWEFGDSSYSDIETLQVYHAPLPFFKSGIVMQAQLKGSFSTDQTHLTSPLENYDYIALSGNYAFFDSLPDGKNLSIPSGIYISVKPGTGRVLKLHQSDLRFSAPPVSTSEMYLPLGDMSDTIGPLHFPVKGVICGLWIGLSVSGLKNGSALPMLADNLRTTFPSLSAKKGDKWFDCTLTCTSGLPDRLVDVLRRNTDEMFSKVVKSCFAIGMAAFEDWQHRRRFMHNYTGSIYSLTIPKQEIGEKNRSIDSLASCYLEVIDRNWPFLLPFQIASSMSSPVEQVKALASVGELADLITQERPVLTPLSALRQRDYCRACLDSFTGHNALSSPGAKFVDTIIRTGAACGCDNIVIAHLMKRPQIYPPSGISVLNSGCSLFLFQNYGAFKHIVQLIDPKTIESSALALLKWLLQRHDLPLAEITWIDKLLGIPGSGVGSKATYLNYKFPQSAVATALECKIDHLNSELEGSLPDFSDRVPHFSALIKLLLKSNLCPTEEDAWSEVTRCVLANNSVISDGGAKTEKVRIIMEALKEGWMKKPEVSFDNLTCGQIGVEVAYDTDAQVLEWKRIEFKNKKVMVLHFERATQVHHRQSNYEQSLVMEKHRRQLIENSGTIGQIAKYPKPYKPDSVDEAASPMAAILLNSNKNTIGSRINIRIPAKRSMPSTPTQ